MSRESSALSPLSRPGVVALVAVYVVYASLVIRTVARTDIRTLLPIYLAGELLSAALFTLMLWRPIRRPAGQHLFFVLQTMLALALLLLYPRFDFVVVLFAALAFEAALVFDRRVRWLWVAALVVLIVVPLVATLGVYGLALSLSPTAACIIFAGYVTAGQEIESGLCASARLLNELQLANRQLTAYAGQVEELSVIQEHNRLARELHDSVSQSVFSILLHSRTARLLLEREPAQLAPQLDRLKSLARDCLEAMRSLISSLRPPEDGSAGRPTP